MNKARFDEPVQQNAQSSERQACVAHPSSHPSRCCRFGCRFNGHRLAVFEQFRACHGKDRLKVQQAIKTLGYSPNFGAQALAVKRTNTIGAIIPTMENAIFARGMQAFQETLAENGITLIIASCSCRPKLEEEQIRSLVARGADALLLMGQSRPAATYQFLARRNIPYVLAWPHKKKASIAISALTIRPLRIQSRVKS